MKEKHAENLIVLVLLLCCSLVLVCPGCKKAADSDTTKSKFEIDKVYQKGPLTVHVRLDKSKITIAQTVLLELEAAIGPGYELTMPKVDSVLENFGIVDWNSGADKLDEKNNIVSMNRYRLEPFLSGTFPIPAFTFEFHDANSPEGKKYELATEPIDVEVTSLLGEDRSKLVIADIEDVVEMPEKSSYWWLWGIGIAGVIAGVLSWFAYRQKRHAKLVRIFKPAHEIAYERLHALVKEDLIAAGRIKEFYERISDIIRHYIEHRFDLKAPEMTTEEFLNELRLTDMLCVSDKNSLTEFLTHCDLVKFAKHSPTPQQIQQMFDLVKNFIEQTKSDERKVDVTSAAETEQTVEIGST